MTWKYRGGRAYYYESERSGDRVVSRYVGTGETARLIAQMNNLEREKRHTDREDERAEAGREAERSGRVQGVCLALTIAADALIEAAGYHRHHRGPWRRRRTMSETTALATVKKSDSTASLLERYNSGDKDAPKEIEAIINEAQAGNRKAAAEFARLVKAAPRLANWLVNDIAEIAERSLIRSAYGKGSLASAELARLRLAELRAELAGPNPSAVERLLAERAALCWLDCHAAEVRDLDGRQQTIRQADFSARKRDLAHRRYLSSLKALAAVRKSTIVTVQVHLGADAAPGPRG